jgi:hypothetical protein
MTRTSGQANDPIDLTGTTPYERLARMDPPALRSLIVELRRISVESAALAARLGTKEASARATRNAQRFAAAQAALAPARSDGGLGQA